VVVERQRLARAAGLPQHTRQQVVHRTRQRRGRRILDSNNILKHNETASISIASWNPDFIYRQQGRSKARSRVSIAVALVCNGSRVSVCVGSHRAFALLQETEQGACARVRACICARVCTRARACVELQETDAPAPGPVARPCVRAAAVWGAAFSTAGGAARSRVSIAVAFVCNGTAVCPCVRVRVRVHVDGLCEGSGRRRAPPRPCCAACRWRL
jgi:hypothetical protein